MSATVPPVCPRRDRRACQRPAACQACAALALIYARPGITRTRPADRQGAPE